MLISLPIFFLFCTVSVYICEEGDLSKIQYLVLGKKEVRKTKKGRGKIINE